MTNQQPVTKKRGFTLIETIIYIALFGIMFTGIFVSIYPFFTGATRLTANVLAQGESAFILAKLRASLGATIVSPAVTIAVPEENQTAHELVVTNGSDTVLHFKIDTSNAFCTPPLICSMLLMKKQGNDFLPLNATSVQMTDFTVKHYPPNTVTGASRYLEVSFSINNEMVGPIRYYLHF